MYSADELNLVRMPDEMTKYPIDEPREICAYLGQGGTVLLLGFTGEPERFWLYFAAVTKAADTEQNTVLLDAMMNGAFSYQERTEKIFPGLGLSWKRISDEWICMENAQNEIRSKGPAEYAAVLAHAHRLYSAEAALRAAGGAYLNAVSFWLRQCNETAELDDLQTFTSRFGALNRILIADRCILLSEDPAVRDAYRSLQGAVQHLDLRFSELRQR
ncbi:MAG: hypothetical protein IKS42_08060 [Oscillospiraceae bacterium]|nr:hypothetical protein [Oscillospiraceae bacterium]